MLVRSLLKRARDMRQDAAYLWPLERDSGISPNERRALVWLTQPKPWPRSQAQTNVDNRSGNLPPSLLSGGIEFHTNLYGGRIPKTDLMDQPYCQAQVFTESRSIPQMLLRAAAKAHSKVLSFAIKGTVSGRMPSTSLYLRSPVC